VLLEYGGLIMNNEKLREIIGEICLFFGILLVIGITGGIENDSLTITRAAIYMLIAVAITCIALYTLKDISFKDEDEDDFNDDFITTEEETSTFAEDTLIVSTVLKLYEDTEEKRRA